MTEPAAVQSIAQRALDDRIEDILAAHGGDWRAAMETLLIAGDAVADSLSYGYVRGRRPRGEAMAGSEAPHDRP